MEKSRSCARTERSCKHRDGNFMNPKESLSVKNIVMKMKDAFSGLMSSLNMVEGRLGELEDELSWQKLPKLNCIEKRKNHNKMSKNHETFAKGITYV